MPSSSIVTSFNKSISDILILNNYINSSLVLDAKYQYVISEVIMLRLFSILESSFAEISFKLSCNAKYKNGTYPSILRRCNSIQQAHATMLTHNRTRAMMYLKWTKTSFIKDSIEHVLDINDKFYQGIRIHSNLINEMRIVRNHIAHRSTSTKNEYISLLRTKYGGNPNLTLGAYLTSTKRNPVANINYYINASRIILDDITKG